jgi:hypothetical protein
MRTLLIKKAILILVSMPIVLQLNAQTVNDNYVKVYKAIAPISGDLSVINDVTRVSVAINYFDGLGRTLQSVIKQGSVSMKDVVQPMSYDSYGRQTTTYLPYTSGTDGSLKLDFLPKEHSSYLTSPQYLFYQNTAKVAMDNSPYTQSIIENSELNRVLKLGAPGTAWQPNSDPYSMTDNTVKKRNELNTANEVLQLSYDPATGTFTGTNTYYGANLLLANRTYDEHNNEVVEYVDKEGRTICKKVKADATQYAITYYIYDLHGNLVAVLPPEAVKAMTAN